MIAVALLAALAAAPAFRAEGGAPRELEEVAARAWDAGAALLAAEAVHLPPAPRPIRIVPSALAGGAIGRAAPGVIAIRPELPAAARTVALRHEVAHQLLFEACPAAAADRLFHEAFALATSGELGAWAAGEERGPYLSLARALELLEQARRTDGERGLDGAGARRALARLLAESPGRPGRLPDVLGRALARCEAGTAWIPIRPQDLAGALPAADALVVLSRHSGEVLEAQGASTAPLPFGSTLKPFLLAGAAGPTPALRSDPSRPEWRCGPSVPPIVDAPTALLRSCNGWFLEWARRAPEVARMGSWGQALLALGLSGLPGDASEAIGVRPSLRISPLGLAHAYRLLGEARPDLLDVLSRNAREGTLANLPASAALRGVALKTGTVLDADGRPSLGLVVAVTPDVVLVMVRAGRSPRTFAADVAERLRRGRIPAVGAARVQVLGLLPPEEIEGRCAGVGFVAAKGGPRPAPQGFAGVAALARAGPLVCAGGPWLLRYPGLAEARPYAGVLTRDPPPALRTPRTRGPKPTAREQRARRGSELVLRTARLAYAAGVVEAEDARLRGEPRIALARVADRNGLAASARHPGRPPCDTTHCQAFRGTARPRTEDRAALRDPLPPGPWLPFAQGGDAPWRAERSQAAVEGVLGPDAQALSFARGEVTFTALAGDREAPFMEPQALPCERLRGPLRLPSCPERAELRARVWSFIGRGAGHGEGLDLEWAARSGLRAEEILRRAYGPAVR